MCEYNAQHKAELIDSLKSSLSQTLQSAACMAHENLRLALGMTHNCLHKYAKYVHQLHSQRVVHVINFNLRQLTQCVQTATLQAGYYDCSICCRNYYITTVNYNIVKSKQYNAQKHEKLLVTKARELLKSTKDLLEQSPCRWVVSTKVAEEHDVIHRELSAFEVGTHKCASIQDAQRARASCGENVSHINDELQSMGFDTKIHEVEGGLSCAGHIEHKLCSDMTQKQRDAQTESPFVYSAQGDN